MGKKKPKQKKYENSEDQFQEERWLTEDINKMKMRQMNFTHLTSPYFSKFKYDQPKQQNNYKRISSNLRGRNFIDHERIEKKMPPKIVNLEMQNEGVSQNLMEIKSIVWQIFVVNLKENRVKCTICEKEYRRSKTDTTVMLAHLKRFHPDRLKGNPQNRQQPIVFKQQTNKIVPQNILNIPTTITQSLQNTPAPQSSTYEQQLSIISQIPLHSLDYQIKTHLRINYGLAPSQSSYLLLTYHWKYITPNNYIDLFTKLKNNNHLFIHWSISSINSKLEYCLMITENMREKVYKYKDSISLWYCEFPVADLQLKGIIYVIGQNKNIDPVLLGLIIVFQMDLEKLREVVMEYFRQIQYTPHYMVVCGPSLLAQACETVLKGSEESLRGYKSVDILEKRVMNIGSSLNSILGSDVQDYSRSIKQILDCKIPQTCEPTNKQFIGFGFSRLFIQKIIELTPLGHQSPSKHEQNLITLLQTLFLSEQTLLSYNSQLLQISETDPFFLFLKNQQLITSNCEILFKIKNILPRNIFIKFFSAYFYGKFYLETVALSVNAAQVKEKKRENKNQWFSSSESKNLYYDSERDYWRCQCLLASLTGLPCPHIIQLLGDYAQIQRYINPRWIISTSQNNKIQISQIFLQNQPSKQQQQLSQCNKEKQFIKEFFS